MSNFNDGIENDSFDDLLANIDLPKSVTQSNVPSESKKSRLSLDNDEESDSILANIELPTTSTTTTSTTTTTDVSKTNCVLVNPKQRGNPILKSIVNIPWEFDETIIPDYVVGATAGILYLSLRYHQLNPDYIHNRLKLLGKRFELRVLLVQVDTKVCGFHAKIISHTIDNCFFLHSEVSFIFGAFYLLIQDPHNALKNLTQMCLLADLTLMLAWNAEEAGKIIETYKMFENKPPDLIMARAQQYPHQKVRSLPFRRNFPHIMNISICSHSTKY